MCVVECLIECGGGGVCVMVCDVLFEGVKKLVFMVGV